MADGVSDGLAGVMVSVCVTTSVGVDEAVALAVEVDVDVEEISVGVTDGVMIEGVIGLGRRVSASTIRRTIPTMMGIICLRSTGGRNSFALSYGVTVGGSPVYPNARKRFSKLSS